MKNWAPTCIQVVVCAGILLLGSRLLVPRLLETSEQDRARSGIRDRALWQQSESEAQLNSQASDEAATVYLAKRGPCYHLLTCGRLRQARIPVKLADVKERYRACAECFEESVERHSASYLKPSDEQVRRVSPVAQELRNRLPASSTG